MRRTPTGAGFTLLELVAVVAIIAMIATLAYRNLGFQGARTLYEQAQRLRADLELARQRSVVTGVPHRLQVDVETGRYWVEWQVADAPPPGEAPAPEPEETGIGPDTPIDLAPPRDAETAFRPLPDQLGRPVELGDDMYFGGVETPEGFLDAGVVAIAFERDGTSQPSEIVLGNVDGDVLVLEVRALADAVRVYEEAA